MSVRLLNRTCSRFFNYRLLSTNTPRFPPHTLGLLPPNSPFAHSTNRNIFKGTARRCFSTKNILVADDAPEAPARALLLGRKGKEEELQVTEQAARQLIHLARQEGQPDQALRITVESGGCHGFQYHLDLTTKVERDDVCFEKDGAKVLVDQLSLSFIEGSKLDFVQELIGSAFRVTQNPKATTGCGCGTSFGV